jgi:ribonuclease HI
MELLAVVRSLDALKRPCRVTVHTDSTYVMKGITEWIDGWKKRNWRTAGKKAVKNVDLWIALEGAVAPHDVSWKWVKGHSGVPENERADRLARQAIPQSGE